MMVARQRRIHKTVLPQKVAIEGHRELQCLRPGLRDTDMQTQALKHRQAASQSRQPSAADHPSRAVSVK
jgi:hypothetical protein